MASFSPDDELTHPVDYRLMANTAVTLFRRRDLLQQATDALTALAYDIARVDAGMWRTERDLHRDFATALDFPSYYGGNLNALNDCLGDVASGDYGVSSQSTGLVLVMVGYDRFATTEPDVAQSVLDIFARQARHALLFGRRLICLVQTDDPRIDFSPVGATPVAWNDDEWHSSSRQID